LPILRSLTCEQTRDAAANLKRKTEAMKLSTLR